MTALCNDGKLENKRQAPSAMSCMHSPIYGTFDPLSTILAHFVATFNARHPAKELF